MSNFVKIDRQAAERLASSCIVKMADSNGGRLVFLRRYRLRDFRTVCAILQLHTKFLVVVKIAAAAILICIVTSGFHIPGQGILFCTRNSNYIQIGE